MSVRVIIPPSPIMSSTEVVGIADETVDAMIAAATEEIDGPDGWLGIAVGPQTLEMCLDDWADQVRLPYPPLISLAGITYVDATGSEQIVDPSNYTKTGDHLWFKSSFQKPLLSSAPDAVRIRYRAGYDDSPVEAGGTGSIPVRIKQAIKLSVQHLRALSDRDVFLQLDVTEGIGRKQYAVTDQAAQIIRSASERLLIGLRRY